MRERATILRLMEYSRGKPKELNILLSLIKRHPYFKGERKKLYSLIVKYKKKGGHK